MAADGSETAVKAPVRVSCVLGDDATALYRHFDSAGALLYVGISLSAVTRLESHRAASCWFPQIATIKIEWYPTRSAALEAEALSIRQERPAFNIQGADWTSWRVQQSADALTQQVVQFRPFYRLSEAGKLMDCGMIRFRRVMAEAGVEPRTADGREFLTGWDVMEILDRLAKRRQP